MNPENEKAPERERKGYKMAVKRRAVIQKIIKLILDEMEEKDKGNLTSIYAIGLLQQAIAEIEAVALMRPVRHSLNDES